MDFLIVFGNVMGTLALFLALYAALEARKTGGPPPQLQGLEEAITSLRQRIHDLEDTPELNFEPFTALLEEFAGRMDQYERDLEEGLDVARRRENRVRQAVRRAISRMEEEGVADPALFAEVEELRRRNGGGGEEEELPPVHEGVEDRTPSSVPGVSVEQLQRARML